MKLAALVSGGKDSLYAAYLAKKQGHEIACVVSLISENQESFMFHTPNAHLVETQARIMGIPLVRKTTKGEKEKELADLEAALATAKAHEIEGVVSGAVASSYQKKRVDAICEKLGLQSIAPLWTKDPEKFISEMLSSGFHAIITAVAAEGLDENWLGRKIDEKCLADLVLLNKKYGVSVNGEGGEYESLVLECPLFSGHIEVLSTEKRWDASTRSGVLEVKDVRVVEK